MRPRLRHWPVRPFRAPPPRVPTHTETISISTAPGAKVLAVAALPGSKPFRVATANPSGLAKVAYHVGNGASGSPVKVTIAVAKNGANGNCSTTFTPKRSTSSAPLTATISAQFQVPDPLPFGAGACATAHPGNSICGDIVVTALIKGFSNYGGVPDCPNGDPTSCVSNPAVLSGQLNLSWAISCPANGNSPGTTGNESDVPVFLNPEFQSYGYFVGPITRVDADTASLQLSADLPFGKEVAGCSVAPHLETVTATDITLELQGGGFPTSHFSAAGPFSPSS